MVKRIGWNIGIDGTGKGSTDLTGKGYLVVCVRVNYLHLTFQVSQLYYCYCVLKNFYYLRHLKYRIVDCQHMQ